jgi:hypothetical protein
MRGIHCRLRVLDAVEHQRQGLRRFPLIVAQAGLALRHIVEQAQSYPI